jgi:hypothetical protein
VCTLFFLVGTGKLPRCLVPSDVPSDAHGGWLSGVTRPLLVHFDHVDFPSRNLMGVGESRWKKTV